MTFRKLRSEVQWRKGLNPFGLFSWLPVAFLLTFLVWLTRLALSGWLLIQGGTEPPNTWAHLTHAAVGSIWMLCFVCLFALPIGLGTSLFLASNPPNRRGPRALEWFVGAIAGAPPLLFGFIGVSVLVLGSGFQLTILTASIVVTVLTIPHLAITTLQALRASSRETVEAAVALGGNAENIAVQVLLPMNLPQVARGAGVSICRGVGETAPMLVLGAWNAVSQTPTSIMDPFVALPVLVFQTAGQGDELSLGQAGIAVFLLLGVLIIMQGAAQWLTQRRSIPK